MNVDFYYSDLLPEAQECYLKAQGITDLKEGNFDMDLAPIFTIEVMCREGC